MKTHPKRKIDQTSCYVFGLLCLLALLATCSTGCASVRGLLYDRLPEILDPGGGKPDKPAPPPVSGEFPAGVQWLHTNVSGWPQTATISDVRFSGSSISFPFDRARDWPGRTGMGTSANVMGNVWIIFEYEGRWYAATWEWLRPGQTSKSKSAVSGEKIKRSPIPKSWRPAKGQRVGIMVSTHARAKTGPIKERSNVAWTEWP
jgi:hypothetical protein